MDLEADDRVSQDVFSRPVATGSVDEVRRASQADTVALSQSQEDTRGSQAARTMDVQREFAHFKKYFLFSVDAKDRVMAKCAQRTCGNVLKIQQHSVYNLKRHYTSHHPSLVNELLAAIAGGSKRGRHFSRTSEADSGVSGVSSHSHKRQRQRQSSIEAALKEKFSQKKALDLYYRFITQDMVPGSLTDSERFRDFLKYLSPDFAVPSRRKLSRDLKVMGSRAKSEEDSPAEILPKEVKTEYLEGDDIKPESLTLVKQEDIVMMDASDILDIKEEAIDDPLMDNPLFKCSEQSVEGEPINFVDFSSPPPDTQLTTVKSEPTECPFDMG